MTDRVIDVERAGGAGNAVPKRADAAPKMSYEEALEYDAKFRWRALPTKSDRARAALIREVERLRDELSGAAGALRFERENVRVIAAELARIRAALPEVVGCAHGEGASCRRPPWVACCLTRERMVKAGLLPRSAPEQWEDDGA